MNISKKAPKVSVCIVTYNQENYIRQCLQSVVDQERDFEIEVIVSDDCSTDNTPNIVREFAEKYDFIIPILREKNIGAFKNFVETHNMAIGEYVCHLDGDDYWKSTKLATQLNAMIESDSSVSWHKVNFFNDAGKTCSGNKMDYSFIKNGVVTIEQHFRLGSLGVHSSIMYKHSARTTQHPIFPALDLFYTWEYLYSGKGLIINDVLGSYRLNSSTSISSHNIETRLQLVVTHMEFYLRKDPRRRKDIFIMALTNLLIEIKNKRKTYKIFLALALKTASIVSPMLFIKHLIIVKKNRFPPCNIS